MRQCCALLHTFPSPPTHCHSPHHPAEACVTNTIPSSSSYKFATPYSEGVQSFAVWKPWLDSTDTECIFFARLACCAVLALCCAVL